MHRAVLFIGNKTISSSSRLAYEKYPILYETTIKLTKSNTV